MRPPRGAAVLCGILLVSLSLRAEESKPPPAESQAFLNVVGVLMLTAGVGVMVGSVVASGDDTDRRWSAAYDLSMVLLSPLVGRDMVPMVAGFGGLGVYNLVNQNSPATRRWVNGAGIVATFAGSALEEWLRTRSHEESRVTVQASPVGMRLALRF